MATFICPNCRSTNLRRSRTQGFGEAVQKILKRRPFRCRDCGWRGILYSPSQHGGAVSKRRAYVFAISLGVIVVILLAVFNLRPGAVENIVSKLFGK